MKALILAAGFGSRLSPITDSIPKSLVKVNGTPILFKQIANLLENNISDITVVCGYKANVLIEQVRQKFPSVKYVVSEDYSKTNNMYSAYLGLKATGIGDCLLMNADVFFDSSVIKNLLSFPFKNAIVVDIGQYNDESMKVVESNGYLTDIAKTINKEQALGNSIDVYKFDTFGCSLFYKKCCCYIEERNELKLWSEVALNDVLKECHFKACKLVGRWYEIDNFEDLEMAERIFSE